jgi:intergrase/recombinase
MGNMSYCRMENTNRDMEDCIEALRDRDISSEREREKAKSMLFNMAEFLADEGIIEGYSVYAIEELIEECE